MANVKDITESKCYGCGVCSLLCPKKCIKMEENNRGFIMPIVNEDKCINCSICINNCPYHLDIKTCRVEKVYAAKVLNIQTLYSSTSGGIFSEIACEFLKNGIVVGVAYDKNFEVKHIIIKKSEDLCKITGSKYVQSNVYESYLKIREALDKKVKVLFSGTGCQIAGLKSFLKREYSNLYTIEVACHGVPSPGFFRTYIRNIEKKYKNKIINYKFRTKDAHKLGEHYKYNMIFENNKNIKKFSNLDPYYSNFLDGESLRKCCYTCKFKGKEREGDILLADYWGIEKTEPIFNNDYGASAVFICSSKGKELFESIKEKTNYIESSFEKATKFNQSILRATKEPNSNEMEKFKLDDINSIKKIKIKNKLRKMIKNLIPEKIKKLVKRHL